jgi:hypothetical protein
MGMGWASIHQVSHQPIRVDTEFALPRVGERGPKMIMRVTNRARDISQVEPFRSREPYVVCCSAELHESQFTGISAVCPRPRKGRSLGETNRYTDFTVYSYWPAFDTIPECLPRRMAAFSSFAGKPSPQSRKTTLTAFSKNCAWPFGSTFLWRKRNCGSRSTRSLNRNDDCDTQCKPKR